MPEVDSSIPVPAVAESTRALLQAFAGRVGLLVPCAPLSHQQIAFAERVVDLEQQGHIGGGQP